MAGSPRAPVSEPKSSDGNFENPIGIVPIEDAPLVAGVNAKSFGWHCQRYSGSLLARALIQDDTGSSGTKNPTS
jgi:hypothetical protein